MSVVLLSIFDVFIGFSADFGVKYKLNNTTYYSLKNNFVRNLLEEEVF